MESPKPTFLPIDRSGITTPCNVCSNENWNGYISWYEMLDCQTVIHDLEANFCPKCGKKLV